MKRKCFLLLGGMSLYFSVQAQTLMTVDASTEYQTIVGMGGRQ